MTLHFCIIFQRMFLVHFNGVSTSNFSFSNETNIFKWWKHHLQENGNQCLNIIFKCNCTLYSQLPWVWDEGSCRPLSSMNFSLNQHKLFSTGVSVIMIHWENSVFNGPQTGTSTSSVTCQSNSTLCPTSLVSLRSWKLQRADLQLWCIIQNISWKMYEIFFLLSPL